MKKNYKYDIAISLAGIHLSEAEGLKKALIENCGISGERIYLYSDQGTWNIGKKIKPSLREIYSAQAAIVVVLLSKAYLKNELTKPEWEAIKTRIAVEGEFLIPIRMEENTMIKDQDEVEGYFDIPWSKGREYIAGVIVERLKGTSIPEEAKWKPTASYRSNQTTNIKGNVDKNVTIGGDVNNLTL